MHLLRGTVEQYRERKRYGPHVQEPGVSRSELRYVEGHKDGDPQRVGLGGQTELIYAPKKAKAPTSHKC